MSVPDLSRTPPNKQLQDLVDSLARRLRPTNHRDLMALAAELWLSCPVYRQGVIRGTSFFMTELEVMPAEGTENAQEEIRQARSLLNRRFASTDQSLLALQEAFGFGGSVVYLKLPISRNGGHECGYRAPLELLMLDHGVKFDMQDGKYKGVCPACNKPCEFTIYEMQLRDQAHNAKLIRIPLALCSMKYNPMSASRELYFNCKDWEQFRKGVEQGDPLFHCDTHGIFIESVRENTPVRLSDKYFHYIGFGDATAIEMDMQGWGLPPFFYAFSDVIAVMLLQKYNQTILADYITPMRYVAPPPVVGTARNMGGDRTPFDPTHSAAGGMRNFASKMASFVSALRQDPSKIGVAPYPLHFGYLGLESTQLLQPDLMTYYQDSLMFNMGIPPEFYRGGIGAQVATPSHYGWLLYIRFWKPLVAKINDCHQWVGDRINEVQRWPKMYVKMVPPNLYAAPDMLPILHMRNQDGKLSDQTLDRMIGVDTEYEQRTVMSEQMERERIFEDEGRQAQRKRMVTQMLDDASPEIAALQQVQMMGQMPPGGMPPGMPPAGAPAGAPPSMPPNAGMLGQTPSGTAQSGVNPAELPALNAVMGKAQQTAMELFNTYVDVTERAAVLRQMEAAQPEYAMFVRQALETLEQDARKQGLKSARGGGQMR